MAPHAVVVHDDPNVADQSDQRSELLRLIAERLGVLPNFFRTAGSAPGLIAGVYQINVQIPQALTPDAAVPVVLSIGSQSTQAGVTVSIR